MHKEREKITYFYNLQDLYIYLYIHSHKFGYYNYTMTINKCQGQTLSKVGVYLQRPVFTHGQLYVAIPRVTSKKGFSIVVEDDSGNCSSMTQNIVCKEIFERIVQQESHQYRSKILTTYIYMPV